jgi:hypothetical protein
MLAVDHEDREAEKTERAESAVAMNACRVYRRQAAAQECDGVPGGCTPEQTCSHRTAAAVDGLYRITAAGATGDHAPRGPPSGSLADPMATRLPAAILPTAQEKSHRGLQSPMALDSP